MKSHDEIADYVKEQVLEETRIRKARIKKIQAISMSSIACIGIIVISLVSWQHGLFTTSPKSNNTTQTLVPTAFDVTANVPAKINNSLQTQMGEASMASPIANDTEKYKIADAVIMGKVISTETVLDGSTVFTKSKVEISESYKGNLKKGDSIYVKELGGFIGSNELSDAITLEKFGKASSDKKAENQILDLRVNGYKVLEKDEKVILFLVFVKDSDMEEFKTNTYEPIRLWQGKLLYNDEYGIFAPYIPSDEVDMIEYKTYKTNEFNSFAESIS